MGASIPLVVAGNDGLGWVGAPWSKLAITHRPKRTRVTLSKAAQLAGLDIYEFMSVCKANQVPTMDISPDELAEEIAGLSA